MDANTNMEDPSRLIEGCGLLIYLKSIASFILIKGYPHHVATLYYASRFAQLREDILEEQTRLLPKHLLIEMKKKITKKWKNSVMDKWMRDQAECSLTTFTRERPSERILFSVACTSPVFSHQTLSETIMDRKERYSPLREFLNNHLKELEEEVYLSRFNERVVVGEEETSIQDYEKELLKPYYLVKRCKKLFWLLFDRMEVHLDMHRKS